jgi:hypothetical protein
MRYQDATKVTRPFPPVTVDDFIIDLLNVADVIVENQNLGHYLLADMIEEAIISRPLER